MKPKPTALDWIAALAALVLLIAVFVGPVWLMMWMNPGIGIKEAAWMVARGAGTVMVMMTGARLARAFKRPK